MRRLALPALLLLSAAGAGCRMGPDYARPELAPPAAYEHAIAGAEETANTAWWTRFGDPVLDGLITEALGNNRSVKIAAANVEAAAAVLTQTKAPLYPSVGYGASAGRQRPSELTGTGWSSAVANPYDSFQLTGSASWELDLWGRVRRLTEAARADVLSTEEARRGVVLSLVAGVAGSYLQLRGLDEQLAIARRSLETYGESVRIFELQFKYGLVSQLTVEQARTQYETAAAAIPQLESQVVATENALALLLGRNPGAIARGLSIRELSLPAVPAGLPSSILESRPDVKQAEQGLVAANARIGAAKALYFPTISLTGVLGTSSAELSNLFKGPASVWNYAGSITGPLFNAGAIRAGVRISEAGRKAALLAYQDAVASAFADVENALVSRTKLVEETAARERLVRAAREYERLATLQYKGGYAPYSTVLQAQEKLFPSELDLAKARTQLLASLVTLYKVMGGGWVEEADRLTRAAPPGPAPAPPPAPAPGS
ncbi:MAG: efflux transporter outer membrane subunit [Acidobacteria bacterium]|nr:MAG: efflux transporter outer membrane subunit [Acidobacteriota bacterium]